MTGKEVLIGIVGNILLVIGFTAWWERGEVCPEKEVRTFIIDLINGNQKRVSYKICKGANVYIHRYQEIYEMRWDWPENNNFENSGLLLSGVIYFEEVK